MKKTKLHNVKSTGFKTPDNYLESFDDKLFERFNEKESIEGIETSGYTIPADYFDTTEANVFKKLDTEDKPVITFKPKAKFYYVAGIAASFLLLLSLFLNQKNAISIDTIDTVALESYLYQEDYTNDDLAVLFKSEDISETDFIDVTISDETINQYLESLDTEDLILE